MKTFVMEELAPEVQQFLEGCLAEKTSVIFAREGQLYGELNYLGPDDDISLDMTPEEEEELLEIITQGDIEAAAGKGRSLEEVHAFRMEKMQGSAK